VKRLNLHHKRAAVLLALVTVADIVSGVLLAAAEHVPVWHGVYCTVGLTTTDGCDLAFHTWPSYSLALIAMVLFVPLWGTVFSFFTTGLMADHVDVKTDKQTQDLKEHLSP
jgi:hypothetical protein